jgi:hypothetical protein
MNRKHLIGKDLINFCEMEIKCSVKYLIHRMWMMLMKICVQVCIYSCIITFQLLLRWWLDPLLLLPYHCQWNGNIYIWKVIMHIIPFVSSWGYAVTPYPRFYIYIYIIYIGLHLSIWTSFILVNATFIHILCK